MTIDPTRIEREELQSLRRDIAKAHGINLFLRYTEQDAARLLTRPDGRTGGTADVSTLKRKRRAGKIPHTPLGDGSVAYLGMMLVDIIAFGERSVLLWGGGAGGGDGEGMPSSPAGGPAPPGRDGGGREVNETEAEGGSDGPVHEA